MYIELSENYSARQIFDMLDKDEKKELLDLLLEDEEKKYVKKIGEMLNPKILEIRDMLATKKTDKVVIERIKDIFKEFDIL